MTSKFFRLGSARLAQTFSGFCSTKIRLGFGSGAQFYSPGWCKGVPLSTAYAWSSCWNARLPCHWSPFRYRCILAILWCAGSCDQYLYCTDMTSVVSRIKCLRCQCLVWNQYYVLVMLIPFYSHIRMSVNKIPIYPVIRFSVLLISWVWAGYNSQLVRPVFVATPCQFTSAGL